MGTWGTGLSSNDTFADIYGQFIEQYNEGQEVNEITDQLLSANKDMLSNQSDANNFWFAVAKAQWECKSLDKEVFNRVKDIIESKNDLDAWRELGADEKDIRKREGVLQKFLGQLSIDREKPKARKKKSIKQPVFEKGTCLTFKLLNGNFGAAIVLEAVHDTPYGLNLVAVTDVNAKERPTTKDVINAHILSLNYASWDNKEQISWFSPNRFKKDSEKFEVIDRIQVTKNYDYTIDFVSSAGDWFIWIIEVASTQFDKGKSNWFKRSSKIKQYL